MNWLEQVIDTVAERSQEMLGRLKTEQEKLSDRELCQTLLKREGEASNIAIAHQLLRRYQAKRDDDKTAFLLMLATEFDPDREAILEAVSAYDADAPITLQRLMRAVEPPRQELFRRLNMAPNGTAALVDLRRDVLARLTEHPRLQGVDADLKHLFVSWFNRGFLVIEAIDWNSSAAVLDKLMRYESVHPMQGWDDLHERLQHDRLCYAFFHPALPGEPLIFVEVALTHGISAGLAEIIGPQARHIVPQDADTAMFYSINNSLIGLRGISFGNFLIKQVVAELQAQYPKLKHFATLSPIPTLRKVLNRMLALDQPVGDDSLLKPLLGDNLDKLLKAGGSDIPGQALLTLVKDPGDSRKLLDDCLRKLTLYYLTRQRDNGQPYDPVARFHLSNGARIERINALANPAQAAIDEAFGCMVNYLYVPDDVIANHEAFVREHKIALSRSLQKEYDRIKAPGE